MISTIGRWTIDHQPGITWQCYQAMPENLGCDCAGCRNFLAVSDRAFCSEFLSIADVLGVDIRKPIELCHYGQEQNGLHLTSGWFHVVGQILSGRDAMKQMDETSGVFDLERIGNAEFGFTDNLALISKPFADKHLIQLEFTTHVPWVIGPRNPVPEPPIP
jgi:hypothetical protein